MMNQMAAMPDGDDELDELERQFQQASTFARTGIKVRSPTEMIDNDDALHFALGPWYLPMVNVYPRPALQHTPSRHDSNHCGLRFQCTPALPLPVVSSIGDPPTCGASVESCWGLGRK